MARTALVVVQPARQGVQLTFTASDQLNGNEFGNDGQTVLIVRNTGAAPVNITMRAQESIDGDLKVPDRVVSVPNGIIAMALGIFLTDVYNQANGTVAVDCAASLQLMALKIG